MSAPFVDEFREIIDACQHEATCDRLRAWWRRRVHTAYRETAFSNEILQLNTDRAAAILDRYRSEALQNLGRTVTEKAVETKWVSEARDAEITRYSLTVIA